jgi:hypothetical protein
MKTTEIVLLLVVALLVVCLVFRQPEKTIIVVLPSKHQPDQPKTVVACHVESEAKFHGFAMA